MAFVPGLSKSQVVKVIDDYANLAPATMQLLDDLSAQINDPNDPASALIARMTVAESDIDSIESSVSYLSSVVSGKQDAIPGISGAEIGTLDGIQSSIQGQLDSKAPLSNPTLNNPTLTGTINLPTASIANSSLQNSSISINGSTIPLGGSATVIGTALPSQTNNAGKALVTDGSSLAWQTVDVSNLTNPTILTSLPQTSTSEFAGSTTMLVTAGAVAEQYNNTGVPAILYEGMQLTIPAVSGVNGGQYSFPEVVVTLGSATTVQGYPGFLYAGGVPYEYDGYPNYFNFYMGFLNSNISPTELSYLDGVTSNLQTQINSITSINNDIKFDSVVIQSSLDTVAEMLLSTGGVKYYQSNDQYHASITVDLAAGITNGVYDYLNSAMTVGQAVTFVLMIKNGATASYPGTITIPAPTSGQTTVRWQGGTAPTSGNLNAVDIYTFTVVKLGNHVFDIFADVAKFA